jgi:Ca-activated chloride channel family protein
MSRLFTGLLLMLWAAASLSVAQQQAPRTFPPDTPAPPPVKQAPKDSEDTPTFRADVRLVNVYAIVTDASGAPVTDLKREQFTVNEDGESQPIAVFEQESERPLSIVLAIDSSASVRKDFKLEQHAAERFVRSVLRPQDAISLFQFAETVRENVTFTSDARRIVQAIRRMRGGSGTAVFDAIYLAGERLAVRNERKVIVIITDGGDTMSAVGYHDAVRSAQQAEAIVYAIIMVPVPSNAGRNLGGENALIQLARDTGGKYFYAAPGGLDDAFKQVSRELRTQYLLAYYPTRERPGSSFRRIEVNVSRPGDPLKVRHRAGYYTSKMK